MWGKRTQGCGDRSVDGELAPIGSSLPKLSSLNRMYKLRVLQRTRSFCIFSDLPSPGMNSDGISVELEHELDEIRGGSPAQ